MAGESTWSRASQDRKPWSSAGAVFAHNPPTTSTRSVRAFPVIQAHSVDLQHRGLMLCPCLPCRSGIEADDDCERGVLALVDSFDTEDCPDERPGDHHYLALNTNAAQSHSLAIEPPEEYRVQQRGTAPTTAHACEPKLHSTIRSCLSSCTPQRQRRADKRVTGRALRHHHTWDWPINLLNWLDASTGIARVRSSSQRLCCEGLIKDLQARRPGSSSAMPQHAVGNPHTCTGCPRRCLTTQQGHRYSEISAESSFASLRWPERLMVSWPNLV